MDGGSENMSFTADLVRRYGMHDIAIAPYHPQSNGLIERGHQTIINAISKYKAAHQSIGETGWTRFLALALWADRITARRTTGYSAFELIYRRECLLPIQLAIESWSLVECDNVKFHEDLILARMRQLDHRMEMENLAARNQHLARTQNKAYFDAVARLRSENQEIQVGDLVLVFRPFMLLPIRSHDTKLDERWQGPYRVKEKPQDSTYYLLEELDGTPMKRKYAGDQVKKYFPRLSLEHPPGDTPSPETTYPVLVMPRGTVS
jgi:hypothetical protein